MLFFRMLGQAELRTNDGRSLASILAQPKRLALLAYLAAARPAGFQRRDTLLALFWPELDQERGRAALRQALYTLRKALGEGVIVTRGDGEVGLDPARMTCDVVLFRTRLSEDPCAAVDLYQGDLLAGFFITDAPEFERWLEEERWQLRREAAAAAWSVAERVREHDVDAAARYAARACALDPFNEEAVRRLMTLLAGAGHRASALQIYNNFARLLERELDTAPSDETRALADTLRTPPERNGNGTHAELDVGPLPVLRPRRWRSVVAASLVVVVAALGMYKLVTARARVPLVSVGRITGDADLRDMLATNLARVEGLRVVSTTRLLELSQGDTSASALMHSARKAGVTRLLEGDVRKGPDGSLRLSLRWTDLRTGNVRAAGEVREKDTFALIDAATADVARDLSLDAPTARFASVTTQSLDAYRRFEEGVRAYYHDENASARRLLWEAVRLDSTFASAWWYLSRTGLPNNMQYAARAARLAERATDHERLFIRASFLSEMDDPAVLAVAETLAIRYPHEPDGIFLLAKAKLWSGDFLGAIAGLREVVRMDSTALLRNDGLRCRACDAMWEIGTALALADSGQALVRYAEEWTHLAPNQRGAWYQLANGYDMIGRYDDAIAAHRRANAIPPANVDDINDVETLIRAGRFSEADAIIAHHYRSGDKERRENAVFKSVISLRAQGRYAEALRAARALRAYSPKDITSAAPEAWVLMDLGRARQAAALWDSMATVPFTNVSPARNARAYASAWTRSAEAYYQAGDSVRVRALVDTVAKWSKHTAFGPARELDHHVRGLLFSMRGDHEAAVREFKAALVSPTNGWTRTNLRLAEALMKTGRNAEAAQVAKAALRGSVGASGFSVPHRVFHELIASASARTR